MDGYELRLISASMEASAPALAQIADEAEADGDVDWAFEVNELSFDLTLESALLEAKAALVDEFCRSLRADDDAARHESVVAAWEALETDFPEAGGQLAMRYLALVPQL